MTRAAALVTAALLLVGCSNDGATARNGSEARYHDGPRQTRVVRFGSAPRPVETACERAAAAIGERFPCPTLLPRPTLPAPGSDHAPLTRVELLHSATGGRVSGISIEYGAPPFRGEPPPGVTVIGTEPWRARPCCFLHVTVEVVGERPFLGSPVVLGGKAGRLDDELGPRFTLYEGHLRFAYKQRGHWYLVTMHEAEELSLTRSVLERVVSGMRST